MDNELNNDLIEWINSVVRQIESIGEDNGKKIIENCGRECASSHELQLEAQEIRESVEDKNDLDLLFKTYKEKAYNTPRLYKEGNKIYLEYHKCGCPIVGSGKINNTFFCNCTRGYTKARYETLFNRPVKVELLKSILNGDDICLQVISL